jgi:two-component system, response regulator PdtaR
MKSPDTSAKEQVRVLVVDDVAEIRTSLVEALADYDIDVVGTAANGSEAVSQARALLPDVVLMDVRMPIMDGIKAARSITREGIDTRILMMTAYEDDSLVREATDAGAAGYLVKGTLVADAVVAIRAAAGRLDPT